MERHFWINEISRAFADRSVVWLSGVWRAGKTTLARSLPGATYFDCELVRVRRALEDPELFWRDQRGVTDDDAGVDRARRDRAPRQWIVAIRPQLTR